MSIDGMVQDVKDLIDHLQGNHDNARCSKYAKCQQPDYKPSFEAKTIEETAVLKAWANKYATCDSKCSLSSTGTFVRCVRVCYFFTSVSAHSTSSNLA
jgi:hypothetical protein